MSTLERTSSSATLQESDGDDEEDDEGDEGEQDSPEPHTTKMKSASSQGPTPLSSDGFLWKHKHADQ